MLYDNGLILELLSNIYSITKDKKYQHIIDDTFEWIVNDMTGEDGSFYSSIDADSEGEEGKFYLWGVYLVISTDRTDDHHDGSLMFLKRINFPLISLENEIIFRVPKF